MKKFLKSIAKKSMSLFLAVVMLMSCWVWVAPEKAAAADSPHEGYYWVEVRCKLTDWASTDETAKNEWKITHSGGTTTLTAGASTAYNNGNNDTTGNYVIAKGWVKGFPTALRHDFARATDDCGDAKGDGFRVENPTVWVGSSSSNMKCIAESGMVYTAQDGGYDIDGWKSDAAPYATSVSSSAAVESKTLGVKEFGAGDVSVAFTKGGVYDQYGVKIAEVEEYKLYADNDGSTNVYTKDDNGVWVSGTTIYASPDAQKGIPNASGTAKMYLFGEGSGVKGCLAEVTLNYPKYTVKVDPDGSITGLGATMDMSDNSPQTGAWTATGPYGSTAAKYPTGTASKTGYTFKGFWSEQQPTTGDAGINADEATFAEPVDTATFNTYKAQTGAVVDGRYVTLSDGKKYYNAGAQWDSTHKEIQGNDTFYGWWIPQDIVVKFYDIDGTYLGTKKAKYGSTQAADWYLNPKDGYNAGAFEYKSFAGKWRDITGIEVVEGSYKFGALATLTLTPIYTTKTYNDKYDVNFIDPSNGGNLTGYSKEYTYRDVLEGTQIPTGLATFGTLANDPGYSYEFSGWTSLKPASGNYHTLAVGDTTITENTDWVVREDITYYAVYRSTVKEYLVAFNYIDSTGANKTETLTVPYGSAIATPAVVNRTYATGGYGYTLAGWTYKNGTNASATLDADGTIVFNNSNVFVTTNNIAPNGTAIVFTAAYGEGQPTPYTVTFKYKDATGKDKVITGEVYHGYKITQELVDELAVVPDKYDDGAAQYAFSNLWKVTEGTAGKAEYTKDEFISFSPVSHVTFEALYGEGVPFYTVKYIDGANSYEERVLAGNNIPAWVVDGEEYAPAKADTETGEYTFAGWFDAAQTDKNFAATNGNKYTLESVVNADITLYSQFIFSPFTFTVKFVNYDGTVLAENKYEAGKSFEEILIEAENTASKPADEVYSYNFIGWDKPLGNNTCEGKDMTFIAQYRPEYIKYVAKWYNDKASMKKAVPELEILGQDGFLAKTSHTYNGKIYAPSVALTVPAGKVFDSWKYIDKDGKEATYVRGMAITAAMSFYATYKDAPVTYTLTAIIGDETYTYELAAGSTAEVAGTPVDGYVDAEKHNKFIGWYTADGNKFDLSTEIKTDITITAKFTVSGHDKSLKELVKTPTYYEAGSEKIWCACSKEDTAETVEIAMLTDTVAPTGTIYLGDKSWSSTDKIGAAATDEDPVEIYVNGNTDIILTINDTGDENAYNTSGTGKGIALIQGIISTGVFGADTTEIAGIETIFSDSTETLNNTANYVIRLGTYTGLEDGKTYIAYYYVKDKAGNVLNKNVRTAKFIYDNTAPEITVAGDNNGAKVPTYCGKAVVKGIENGSTVLVNGNEVTLTTSGAAGTSHYEIKEAGNYLIKVTDKAGNEASKKIIVADGHDEIATSKAVSCTEDGYEKIICATCNKEIKEETITSEGHKYGAADVIAATCTEDGYTVETCTVCGYENKTNVTPMLNHVDTGRRTEVTKVATCSVKGEKTTYCEACNAVMGTEEIDYDTDNGHTYGATKVLKPTCTAEGKKYQQCKYCYAQKTIETIAALNHEGTGRYTAITKEATCYLKGEETTYCKVCDEPMGDPAEIDTIPHTLKLVEYTSDADKTPEYPNGYKQYECQVEKCDLEPEKIAIEIVINEYTVTFVGMGENGADIVFTRNANETITAEDLGLETNDQGYYIYPTKASTNEQNFEFAGWKNSDNKLVKDLPITVTKNETYTLEFTATTRTYTHTFKLSDDTNADVFATIIGTYGAINRKPTGIPTKPATDTATYKFDGWKTVTGETPENYTMTGDATFIAEFTKVPTEFNAVFYNEGNDYIWSQKVTANGTVKYNNKDQKGELIVPTKAPDKDEHYVFAGWEYNDANYAIDDEITPNTADNIRIFATYTGFEHTFVKVNDETKTWAATCTKAGQTTYKCSDCDVEKAVTEDMIEHNYVLDTVTGSKTCSMCGDFVEAEAKEVTLTFKHGDNKVSTRKLAEGKDCTITAADKADTPQYTYKFLGWYDEDDKLVSSDKELTVTAGDKNATYTAKYESITRTYTVSYVNYDRTVLQTFDREYAYGEPIPAYSIKDAEGNLVEPTKKRDAKVHYIFDGWSVDVNGYVTVDNGIDDGKLMITAKYRSEAHDTKRTISTEATCTTPATTYEACSKCDYSNVVSTTGSTLPHIPDPTTEEYEAPGINDGYRTFKCANCGTTITEKIPANKEAITLVIYNSNGILVGASAAHATLYQIVDGNEVYFVGPYESNNDGEIVFEVPKGSEWKVAITGDNIEGGYGGKVKAGINTFGKPAEDKPADKDDHDCACSCHKNTFWGLIYRLFQKLVKMFAGNPKCCGDPDSRI